MSGSIRWRIILPFTLLIALSILGLELTLSRYFHQQHVAQTRSELQDQAELIAVQIGEIFTSPAGQDQLDRYMASWTDSLDSRITVIDQDGEVLADTAEDPRTMDNHLNRPEIQQAVDTGYASRIRFSSTVGKEYLYVAVPVYSAEDLVGFVRTAVLMDTLQQEEAGFSRLLVIIGGSSVILAVALAALIAHLITKPLRSLTESARKLASGQDQSPLEVKRDDEIGDLTRAYNALVRTLQLQIQALEREQGMLGAVLRQMTDGVIIVNQQSEITLINPAAENLFQVEARQALGTPVAELLRYHQWIDLWHKTRQTDQVQAQSLEIPNQDKFVQGVFLPLRDTLPGHFLLLFQDLSRIRRLETTRRDFISNISHELRTPLASLKALTETLQDGALQDPPAADRFLTRIEIEVDALAQMVNELLDLSRIESGQVNLELEPVQPLSLLEDVRDRMKAQAERKSIDLRVAGPDHITPIKVDYRRIEQVLVNLIHNAVKYSPAGGEIVLEAVQEGEQLVLRVSDQGPGIPREQLGRIFERFFKIDRARSSGGTGLGLSIARHLVEAHGGEIWAESREGRGSTFSFSIPWDVSKRRTQ